MSLLEALPWVARNRETKVREDDFFPTPAHATEALLRVEQFPGIIWEPACGAGHMSNVLLDAGYCVDSTDLVDRGFGRSRIDFLMEQQPPSPGVCSVVTNPPFKLAAEFARHALSMPQVERVALLLRVQWLAGQARADLHEKLSRVWVFRKRLAFLKGGVKDYGAGGMIDYAWFVWDKTAAPGCRLDWLGEPSKKEPLT